MSISKVDRVSWHGNQAGYADILIDYMDHSYLFVKSSITGLSFSSNLGPQNLSLGEGTEPSNGVYNLAIRETPTVITVEAPGFVQTKFQIDKMQPKDAVYFLVDPNIPADDLTGWVSLSSDPEGATVDFVNFSMKEKAPVVLELTQMRYSVRVSYYGFADMDTTISVVAGVRKAYEFELSPSFGFANVAADRRTEITIDGREIQPNERIKLDVGSHIVRASREGFMPQQREITIDAGKTFDLSFSLEPLPGRLVISTFPGGAALYINDSFVGKSPLELERLPGKYVIRAELYGYTDGSRKVTVEGNKTNTLGLTLHKIGQSKTSKDGVSSRIVYTNSVYWNLGVSLNSFTSDRFQKLSRSNSVGMFQPGLSAGVGFVKRYIVFSMELNLEPYHFDDETADGLSVLNSGFTTFVGMDPLGISELKAFFGVGYSFSTFSTSGISSSSSTGGSDDSTEPESTMNTSSPLVGGGIHINFGNAFGVRLAYRQTVNGKEQNALISESARAWRFVSLGLVRNTFFTGSD